MGSCDPNQILHSGALELCRLREVDGRHHRVQERRQQSDALAGDRGSRLSKIEIQAHQDRSALTAGSASASELFALP